MPLIAGTEFESGNTTGAVVNTNGVLDSTGSAIGNGALQTGDGAGALVSRKKLEDPLAYLPYCPVREYRKGKTIYGANEPATKIHLVIDGAVKVCRITETGRKVLMDIYQADEFFGESAFLASAGTGAEMAVAVENTKVMAWTVEQVEDIILSRHSQLAIGLLQLITQRSADFALRIESFSVDPISKRLARALLRFSGRLGHDAEGGGRQMMPFTHELLGQYIGTSRELVTQYMNQFRQQGCLSYSRKSIVVYPDKMEALLANEAKAAA